MKTIKGGAKTVALENGEFLHFWYANNAGRGSNNCTIIRSSSPKHAAYSRNQSGVVSKTLTSAWRGNVNFSASVRASLGI